MTLCQRSQSHGHLTFCAFQSERNVISRHVTAVTWRHIVDDVAKHLRAEGINYDGEITYLIFKSLRRKLTAVNRGSFLFVCYYFCLFVLSFVLRQINFFIRTLDGPVSIQSSPSMASRQFCPRKDTTYDVMSHNACFFSIRYETIRWFDERV